MAFPYPLPAPAPPPDPPERPEGVSPWPRWPAWFAPVGFLGGFVVGLVLVIPLGIAAVAAGVDEESPALTVASTVILDIGLIATAVFLASRITRPRLWHFGLRRTRFWPALGWAALTMFSYYVFAGVYSALVDADAEQTVSEDLGADEGTLALVIGAIVVVVLAPIAEEFFFRGFFYRALRNRLGIWAAALIDGAVFGTIHFTGGDTLPLLPVLGALGFAFCLLYERTRSLYPCIALHAFNNTIAYSVATSEQDGYLATVPLGVAMIASTVLVPRFVGRAAPAIQ